MNKRPIAILLIISAILVLYPQFDSLINAVTALNKITQHWVTSDLLTSIIESEITNAYLKIIVNSILMILGFVLLYSVIGLLLKHNNLITSKTKSAIEREEPQYTIPKELPSIKKKRDIHISKFLLIVLTVAGFVFLIMVGNKILGITVCLLFVCIGVLLYFLLRRKKSKTNSQMDVAENSRENKGNDDKPESEDWYNDALKQHKI